MRNIATFSNVGFLFARAHDGNAISLNEIYSNNIGIQVATHKNISHITHFKKKKNTKKKHNKTYQ